MSPKMVSILFSLVPLVSRLAADLLVLAEQARADGYEIPSVDELARLQEQLRGLEDLAQHEGDGVGREPMATERQP